MNEDTDISSDTRVSLGEAVPTKDASRYAGELGIPGKTDAYAVHQLIQQCPPLDLNSVYTYLLLSEHFSDTCVIARGSEGLDGFTSAYIPPGKSDVLFVWQIAVHERARGKGLGRLMVRELLRRQAVAHIKFIETTIGPDNLASRGLFAGLARQLNATTTEHEMFDSHLFGPSGHEDERLIRIEL